MAKQPTLQEIADALGLAKSTVSYALRESSKIPSATREKVKEAAKRMGYKPNPLVGIFMAHLHRTKAISYQATLAWLTFYAKRAGWKENRTALFFCKGAKSRCEERGYKLEEFWMRDPSVSAKQQLKILEARGIRGVFVSPLPASMGHISVDLSKFAAVTCGYSMVRPNLDRAGSDTFNSVLDLLRKAKSLGYRRIGAAYSFAQDRRQQYLISAAIETYKLHGPRKVRISPLIFDAYRSDLASLLVNWIHQERLDFVMADTSQIAVLLRDAGFRLPEDLGFAALNRLPDESDVAGINLNPEKIGATAADCLINLLQTNEYGVPRHPCTLLIPGEWIDGPTVASQK